MATAWDRHNERSLSSWQDRLVRQQIRDAIAPFSPLWRRRFAELDRRPESITSVADLETVPAMGERDVSPTGDPAGMSVMVLQADETGFSLHAPGPDLRRAFRLRLGRVDAYRRVIEADTRPTSYLFSGLGFRYPLASTRRDLDAIARAGARLWSVLGLTRDDVLVSAVPAGSTVEHLGIQYAALAAGAPALFPGDDVESVAAAIRLAPPTVLAVPSAAAGQLLAGLAGVADLATVQTLLLIGAPTDAERIAAAHGMFRAGGPSDTAILAVHAPAGARLLWGECRQSAGSTGLHTYPDLDIVQLVDPDTGEHCDGPGELVLTQVGLQGSALVRWRSGDVVTGVARDVCPACGRTVPRVMGTRRGALVARFETGRCLDLRSVAGVMAGRPDIPDWRLVVAPRNRDAALSAVLHFVAVDPGDPAVVIRVATDLRAVTGSLPSQLVAAEPRELAALGGNKVSSRILIR